jgi:carbon storage regulator
MLVLSRRRGETIVIDKGITVTILEVRGGKVRLGVDAPADTPVHRGEIARQLNGRKQIRSRQEYERA